MAVNPGELDRILIGTDIPNGKLKVPLEPLEQGITWL